jgi:hypothetical protein
MEGSPLPTTKDILKKRIQEKWHACSIERSKTDKNKHIHHNLPWITSPRIQDTAHIADWWHKVEQKLISSVNKYHRTWTNLRGAANTDPFFSKYGEYVFQDSQCTFCTGNHTDNFTHTMISCTVGKKYDTELLHSINKILQEHNPNWPMSYPLWFDTAVTHKNTMFSKFNTAHGLIGYLPANIHKLIKKTGIRNEKLIKTVLDKIDQTTKINRFNKWHNKWQEWHNKHNTDSIKRKIHTELHNIPFFNGANKNTIQGVNNNNNNIEPTQTFNVDRILTHRKTDNDLYEFLVRWENYTEDNDTWEPETHLEGNPCLTEYWQSLNRAPTSPTSPPIINITYAEDETINLTTQANKEDKEWEFDEILSHRQLPNKNFEYLIKWKNFGEKDNTWEPSDNVHAEHITKYWKRVNQKRQLEREAIETYNNNTALSYKKKRITHNRKRKGILTQAKITDMLTKCTKQTPNNSSMGDQSPSPPTASPQPAIHTSTNNDQLSSPPTASPQPIVQQKLKRKVLLDINPYDFILPEDESDSQDESYKTPKQLYIKKPKHKHKHKPPNYNNSTT